RAPRSPSFPSTTLFRSLLDGTLSAVLRVLLGGDFLLQLLAAVVAIRQRLLSFPEDLHEPSVVIQLGLVLPIEVEHPIMGRFEFRSEEHTSELQSRENLV